MHDDVGDLCLIVNQFSTRGTIDSDKWFQRLVEGPVLRSYHPLGNG